jgi:hypothetical protein
MEAVDDLMEDFGWTPITIGFAERLRQLNERHQLWADEARLRVNRCGVAGVRGRRLVDETTPQKSKRLDVSPR